MFDTVIIGGGAGGLAAAMVLARANRMVVVIDAGRQSNQKAPLAHGVFSRDSIVPEELYDIVRMQLLTYPTVVIRKAQVLTVVQKDFFEVGLDTGEVLEGTSLVLAQGMIHTLPEIEGVEGLWGTKVWNCPFCHGYEANDKYLLAVVSDNTRSEMKLLLKNWSNNIVWVSPDEVSKLEDISSGVMATLADGTIIEVEEVVIQTTPHSHDPIADSLGCALTDEGHLVVDVDGKTSVENVYSAGDQSSNSAQVNFAVAAGHAVGTAIIKNIDI